ncbi:hypothetical protein [Pararhodobacter oceanensis]|uniref:hypothetical protein n=1 Tax=Pararhodobacter oceanensis TaxID=2172121 RepID=UPI003A95BE43
MKLDSDQNERLEKVLQRFRKDSDQDQDASNCRDFDISKPNLHDNKQAFLREKQVVEEGLASAKQLNKLLVGSLGASGDLNAAANICAFVDQHSRSRNRNRIVWSIDQLIRNNVSDAGLTFVLNFILADLRFALLARHRELETQEKVFWSGTNRPPNHFARTIAHRLARFIASGTGQMPTFGTSRHGGHPSTDYGRALQEVFEILEIEADFRRPGQWAISQLTDDDLYGED